MDDTDKITLPLPYSVLMAVIAVIVLMLLLAGSINQHRRANQLTETVAVDCAVFYPPEVLRKLKTLRSKKRLSNKYAQSVAREVQALYEPGRRVKILYERRGMVWTISYGYGPRPNGQQDLVTEWGDWSSLKDQDLCRGALRDQSFVVQRTVMLSSGHRIVVLSRQYMST